MCTTFSVDDFRKTTIVLFIYRIPDQCVLIMNLSLSVEKNPVCLRSIADEGIYVIAFSYPVVPKGKARIRVQISAAHSEQDIDRTVNAFVSVGKELGVLKN